MSGTVPPALNGIDRNALVPGDRDRVRIVRPDTTEIDGIRCVGSVAELPDKVDLFVVAISAAQVQTVVTDSGLKPPSTIPPPGTGEEQAKSPPTPRAKTASARKAHRYRVITSPRCNRWT